MNLFIDCEFNEFRGELISMGIVSEDSKVFYEVLPCENPKQWVMENVIPVLDKSPITLKDFQTKLQNYLNTFNEINIISDWPDDIKLFCEALVLDGGYRLNTPPLTMQILRDIDSSQSVNKHNAISDAFAIKDRYYEIYKG